MRGVRKGPCRVSRGSGSAWKRSKSSAVCQFCRPGKPAGGVALAGDQPKFDPGHVTVDDAHRAVPGRTLRAS